MAVIRLVLAVVVLALPLAIRAQSPQIDWASQPVMPNQTVLVIGGPFDDSCSVTISPISLPTGKGTPVAPIPNQTTIYSLKFVVPAHFAEDAYDFTVECAAGTSQPHVLNAPQPFWIQGDLGDSATADGGWLRVLGNNVAFLTSDGLELRRRLRAARRRLLRNRAPGSSSADSDDDFLETAAQAAMLMRELRHRVAPTAILRLTPFAGGPHVDIPATMANATQWSIHIPLSADLGLAPGFYNISLSNGVGGSPVFVPLDSFVSPSQPHVSGILLKSRKEATWLPDATFIVSKTSVPVPWPWNLTMTSDEAVQDALDQARVAGGGTILFPAGTYFLSEPLVVPPNTVIAGESAATTAIYFAEQTNYTAPNAYFQLDASLAAKQPSGSASWGVRDFTFAVTGFHYSVFFVSNYTSGFFMDRIVARVDAFFAGNNAGTIGVEAARSTHSRWANWTLEQPGNLIQLNGNNFRITNCDLWGTYNVITSFGTNGKVPCNAKTFPNSCHGATYGWIADNVLYNGGASHFMNQWRQIIFERNIATGVSPIAMGQAVGTGPDGGYDHHIFHADNIVRLIWGNDRELMTFDDAGGSYWGRVQSVDGTRVITAGDCKSAGDMAAGGWAGGTIVVVNGTGAGQWRRIIVPGIDSESHNPNNRTWIVDAPFAVTPSADSFIEIMPFRGRNIFTGDTWEDGGAFQFYGHAIENIVADNTFERMTAIVSWGQWRGWLPPNRTDLGGTMNNGLQPNLQNQFIGNVFRGSISIPNYNYSTGYDPFYSRRFFATQPCDNVPHSQYANFGLIFRENYGGGGYSIAMGTSDVVIEGGVFVQDKQSAAQGGCVLLPPQAAPDGAPLRLLVRNVTCLHSQTP